MTTEQKLIFWANAYNAALTGFLSVRATHYALRALEALDLEKQAPMQEPREGFR
jgi:hypothetical protein